jgi:NAD+ synthase
MFNIKKKDKFMKLENYLDYLVTWIKDEVKNANLNGCIIGLSGGIDSAVAAALVKQAMGDQCLALIMPCLSNPKDQVDAIAVAKKFGIKYQIINLDPPYKLIVKNLDKLKSFKYLEANKALALANTKARLRMTTLYELGQTLGYMVVGTDNAAEWYTGYFTKYGDGGVDIVPLIQLTKGEVFEAAKILDVPPQIIKRKPTAGLVTNVYDEDELQLTYKEIDQFLIGKKIKVSSKKRLEHLHRNSEHKRHLARGPKPLKRSN